MGDPRAKSQYDILAFHYPSLVKVIEQDKRDLEELARRHKGETAQRWYNRMKWKDGHEKMITFGASIDVRAAQGTTAVKGFFCYERKTTSGKAHYQGVRMEWGLWSNGIKHHLDNGRARLSGTTDKQKRQIITDETLESAIMAMYYQDGLHLTIPNAEPKKELDRIKTWIYRYFKDGKAAFPFQGEIPNADVNFTIDFIHDVEIVETFNGVSESNTRRGKEIAANNANDLPEGELSRQEIIDLKGKGKFDRMAKHGKIVKVKGRYGYWQRKQD